MSMPKYIYDTLRNQGIPGEPFIPLIGQAPEIRRYREQDADLIADILSRNQAQNFYKPADIAIRLKSLLAFHFDYVIDHFFQQSSSVKVDLAKDFSGLTLSIISSCAFGQSFETISNVQEIISRTFTSVLSAIAYRVSRMISYIPLINQLPFWKKDLIDHGTKEMNDFVDQIITNRRKGQSQSLCIGSDLLDLLLSACDNQGQTFTNQEIKDQTLTFILAGHETTSNLMAWILYELMNNPSVYRACQEEVDRILPQQIVPTWEHLNELIVLESIFIGIIFCSTMYS